MPFSIRNVAPKTSKRAAEDDERKRRERWEREHEAWRKDLVARLYWDTGSPDVSVPGRSGR